MRRTLLLAAAIALLATAASAHTGEAAGGGFVTGFLHPILGWDHVAAMVAVGLWGAFLGPPAIWLLPVTFPLVMALGGALGVAGVPIPGIEFGIAASALIIGVAVMLALRPPLVVAAVIVGFFAIFHGHAHGTEMPRRRQPARLRRRLRDRHRPPAPRRHLARPARPLADRRAGGPRHGRRRSRSPGSAFSPARCEASRPRRGRCASVPGAAAAHDAFGDLGPFYASLLHPLADPAQGLLVAAAAVLLARQPLATVRPAYAALAACGALAVGAHSVAGLAPLGLRATGIAVAALGLVALSGLPPAARRRRDDRGRRGRRRRPRRSTCRPAPAPAALAALGGAAGIALLALLVWGGVDLATRRLGPIAGAVAGAWIAAIGIMSAALPA